ncbi:hypothetical protein [Actinokineospora sp. NBRC 105648]|uniref:hypothetical protein n=1 Tax=Actinokineospora sp. NBRC 105648 TaxID=3032206 RepID=UPI0024A1368E|nr:hypothetical protein [Actinokineospora sp. NBRC 105648]GLZ42053.1 hypothetical protein Acsp05_56770 [Actinokineospora sp. NBRC 105648]
MDRPTTGRRRVRSGSVHVTELIRRHPVLDLPADPDPAEPPVAPEAATRLADAPEPEPGKAGSRTAQLAKLTGLGLAVVTLCGAIATATVIARERQGAQEAPSVRPGLQITGERALLPHELNRAVTTSGGKSGDDQSGMAPPATGAASGNLSMAPAPTSSTPPRGARSNDTSPARSGQVPGRRVTSSRELVLEYYRLIEVNPRGAFDLVAADLLGTTLNDFLGSWTDVTRIEVLNVVERPDGVLAVIRMQLSDGSHLRVQQLLTVTKSAPQRIVGAELVSAQLD